jgi:hypothetical protein
VSKNLKIRIYKTIILPVVLYGCETWSLTLREAHRLRVFENRVPRKIFGPKRDEVTGQWRKLHNEELRDLYSSPSMIRIIKSRRIRWAGMYHEWGRRGPRVGYWWESQRERVHYEDQDIGGWIILGWILERWEGVMWTGLVWLRIGTGGRALVNSVLNLRVP